jgi:hypothetical protein
MAKIRFYSKEFLDKFVKVGAEQIITPKNALREELQRVLH